MATSSPSDLFLITHRPTWRMRYSIPITAALRRYQGSSRYSVSCQQQQYSPSSWVLMVSRRSCRLRHGPSQANGLLSVHSSSFGRRNTISQILTPYGERWPWSTARWYSPTGKPSAWIGKLVCYPTIQRWSLSVVGQSRVRRQVVDVFINRKRLCLMPQQAIGGGGEADIFRINTSQVLKLFKPPSHPDYAGQPHEQQQAEARLAEHQAKLPAF